MAYQAFRNVCNFGGQRQIADLALKRNVKQNMRFGSAHFGKLERLNLHTTPCGRPLAASITKITLQTLNIPRFIKPLYNRNIEKHLRKSQALKRIDLTNPKEDLAE